MLQSDHLVNPLPLNYPRGLWISPHVTNTIIVSWPFKQVGSTGSHKSSPIPFPGKSQKSENMINRLFDNMYNIMLTTIKKDPNFWMTMNKTEKFQIFTANFYYYKVYSID